MWFYRLFFLYYYVQPITELFHNGCVINSITLVLSIIFSKLVCGVCLKHLSE
jgi:hypothetical protein